MTDLEFATCDLEHINDIINPVRKKFYELEFNDSVYAVAIALSKRERMFAKYEFKFKGMERPMGSDATNTKARLYNIYFDEPVEGYRRRGIQTDKNRSCVVKEKKLKVTEAFLIIYATTLEECVEKAEKILNIPVEQHLRWVKA